MTIAQPLLPLSPRQSSLCRGANTGVRAINTEVSDDINTEVIDKQRIAASFSAAATTYDSLAAIQKDVGLKLLSCCQPLQASAHIADIGCGTGWLTEKLRQRFPEAMLLGIDLAEGMISYASQHQQAVADHWWVADMEALPVAGESLDLLYSNLAMQWLEHPLCWLEEAWRVLRPGGQLLCSTLLPGTLYELAECWAFADQAKQADVTTSHVNRFLSLETLRQAVRRAGFEAEVRHYQDIRYYTSVREIMAELKGIGANNINRGRSRSVTSKGRIRLLLEHYERFLTANGYPATYQVALITLTKPE